MRLVPVGREVTMEGASRMRNSLVAAENQPVCTLLPATVRRGGAWRRHVCQYSVEKW